MSILKLGAGTLDLSQELSTTQIADVFTPLFAARAQSPAMPEVYDLIARVWVRSAFKPTHGHLAVLDEGVLLFPRRSTLVYATAELYARNGFLAEASELIKLGLVVAADAVDRERFAQLQQRLPAAPAPN